MEIGTIISLVGTGHRFISGINQGEKLEQILDELKRTNRNIRKLSENRFYFPDFSAIENLNENFKAPKYADLQTVQNHLNALNSNNQIPLLSSAMTETNTQMRELMQKNPREVLDSISKYDPSTNPSHSNPDMIPIVFEDNNERLLGWQLKGVVPMLFGWKYNPSTQIWEVDKKNVSNSELMLLFEEDFTEERHFVHRNSDYGKSIIIGDKLVIEPKKDGMVNTTYLNIDTTRNFIIESEMSLQSSNVDGYFGIMWGYKQEVVNTFWSKKDNSVGYEFLINGNKRFAISRGNEGIIYGPSRTRRLIRGIAYNKLAIQKKENLYFFYINNHLVCQMPFTEFFGDRVGFSVYGSNRVAVNYVRIFN